MLLDRLYGTLEERIEEWKKVELLDVLSTSEYTPGTLHKKMFSFLSSKSSRSAPPPDVINPRIEERLRLVAVDVARGLEYLHSNRIIFRDLKPSNVGFLREGTIKLFDFGLAREILSDDHRMTPNTGSLRWMAPEVNKGEHYGYLPIYIPLVSCSGKSVHSYKLLMA